VGYTKEYTNEIRVVNWT